MGQITRIAVDTSKAVFTLNGVDAQGRAVLRRNLRRRDIAALFARLEPLEAAAPTAGARRDRGHSAAGRPGASPWLPGLLARKLAAVALANNRGTPIKSAGPFRGAPKMARIVWAMLTSGEAYRQASPVAA